MRRTSPLSRWTSFACCTVHIHTLLPMCSKRKDMYWCLYCLNYTGTQRQRPLTDKAKFILICALNVYKCRYKSHFTFNLLMKVTSWLDWLLIIELTLHLFEFFRTSLCMCVHMYVCIFFPFYIYMEKLALCWCYTMLGCSIIWTE